MNQVLDGIDKVVTAISGVLYMPWVPFLLLAAGLFFTFRSKFMQVRLLGESFRVVSEKPKTKGGISSFGALMVSTASRVGTGNIVGVSTAICMGGYGAVFWMWMTAILGGATSFIESTLAQVYKRKNPDGTYFGGPSYYMETALKKRWLGVIFAVIIILTYAVGYNMLASYNLQSSFSAFSFYHEGSTPLVIGIILALLFAVCVMGGAKRLTKITGALVPIMGIFYVAVAVVVVVGNASIVPEVFRNIFASAFDFPAIFGGFTGSCMMEGIKRGLYSNEAGMGSAPNAAATADVSHPAKQGLVQMLAVFIDTLLICSATALMCLCSGVAPSPELKGVPYVQAALGATFGPAGNWFITVMTLFFAFTTILGNYYYCESNLHYILSREARKTELLVFRIIAVLIVFQGARLNFSLVWDTADVTMGFMALINLPSIVLLAKPALLALQDYTRQRREGKDPVFHAADIGLGGKTAYWN